jgi:hypothetical protein
MYRFLTFFFLMLLVPAQAQHKKANYKKFAGTITVIDQDAIKYDGELLIIYKTDKYLWQVFESGLLFPALFEQPGVAYQKTNATNPMVHNFTVVSSQWINSKSGKVRLFKVAMLPKDSVEPTEYLVELYNPKGTSKGDFRNFLRGAQLRSFKKRG